MPSGLDDFLLSSLDMYLPSSGMEIIIIWYDKWLLPLVFFTHKIHVEYLSIQLYTSSDRGFAKDSATERK